MERLPLVMFVWEMLVILPACMWWGHWAANNGIPPLLFVFCLVYGLVILVVIPWVSCLLRWPKFIWNQGR